MYCLYDHRWWIIISEFISQVEFILNKQTNKIDINGIADESVDSDFALPFLATEVWIYHDIMA